MRALSPLASGLRHSTVALLEALVVAAIVVALLLALSPLYKPAEFLAGTDRAQAAKVTARISFANADPTALALSPSRGEQVTFAVDASVVKSRDLYSLWVANKCSQNGELVYAEYLAVHDGLAGPFTLDWAAGPADCTAYVWLFPSSESPLRGASTTYTAN